ALVTPARPLFLGRKPCVPSSPVYSATVERASIFDALLAAANNDEPNGQPFRLQWPASEPPPRASLDFPVAFHFEPICDERNWITGVTGGQRMVGIGELGRISMDGQA